MRSRISSILKFLCLFYLLILTGPHSPCSASTVSEFGNSAYPSIVGDTNCDPGFYQTIGNNGTLVQYSYDGFELGFTTITVFGFEVNATAFNVEDGFLYTIARNSNHLIRFSTDGSWTDLGPLPITGNMYVGSFDTSGNYYVCQAGAANVYKIDVSNLNVETLPISTAQKFNSADWAYVETENKFYGVGGDFLYAFDPVDYSVTREFLTGLDNVNGGFGGAFSTLNGALFVSNNSSGDIFFIDVTSLSAIFILGGPSSGINDGASCPCSLPPFPTIDAEDDEICINSGEAVSILNNDTYSFADLDNSSFEIIIEPTNGTLFYSEASGAIIYYTDDPSIEDYFVYSICLDLNEEICDEAVVTYLPSTSLEINEFICEGEEVEFEGNFYTEDGTFEFNYFASNGCDSVVLLNIEVYPEYDILIEEEICDQTDFIFSDEVYTEQGVYEFDLQTEFGCDSVVVIDLIVNPIFDETINATICDGEGFVFNDFTYEDEGMFNLFYFTESGCDSIYTFNISVNRDTFEMMELSICSGETYELNDVVYSEEGMYTQELTASNGCDSILTLALNIKETFETFKVEEICNGEVFTLPDGSTYTSEDRYEVLYEASNGCDSVLVLDLKVNNIYEESLEQFICEGESFAVGDSIYFNSGSYTNHFTSTYNCDSIINLMLTVGVKTSTIIDEEICEGESFDFGGQMLNDPGTYERLLSGINTCDSLVTLNLQVLENKENNIDISICEGDSFEIGNTSYFEEGYYEEYFSASNGCDSLVTLDLKIAPNYLINLDEEICEGESYIVNNVEYFETGDFEIFIQGENGCDSTINLSLIKYEHINIFSNPSICEGELHEQGGQTYSEDGVYVQNYFTQNGCDSIVTIDLSVRPTSDSYLEEKICEGEEIVVGQEIFSETGFFEILLTAENGCDSLVSLDLIKYQSETLSLNEEICDGEEIVIGADVFNSTGQYTKLFNTINGCDSTVILNLTVNQSYEFFEEAAICDMETYEFAGQIFDISGLHEVSLSTMQGCDSVLILDLEVKEEFLTTLDEVVCLGSTYTVGESIYSEEGFYTNSFTAQNGCDSIVELNLKVNQIFSTTLNEQICEGDEFTVGLETFSESGFYDVLIEAANGCDSLITLDLEVLLHKNENFQASICEGEAYTFGNMELETQGAYIQELYTSNGCDSIVNLELRVLDVYELEFEQEICEGESYEIGTSSYSVTGTYEDLFTASNGCDSLIITNLIVNQNSNTELEEFTCLEELVGQEISILQNINGCDRTVVINTYLKPESECFVFADIEGMTIPCAESTGFLAIDLLIGTPPFTINWNGADTGSQVQEALGQFTIENLMPGLYVIEIIDANDNSLNLNSEILQYETPEVIAEVPLSFSGYNLSCFGGQNGAAEVTGIGGTAPYTYQWSNGETSSQIEDLTAGTYIVTLTDANDCIDITQVELTQPPILEIIQDPIDLLCDDAQSGVVELNANGGVAPYLFALNESELQEENVFINLEEGEFASLIVDANGCSLSDSFSLFMPTPVEVELGEDIYIDLGESVQLQANLNIPNFEVDSVLWSSNLISDCDQCLVQSITPTGTNTYTIYVLDENGCENIDEVTIHVNTDQTVYIPNAFSPNGDGVNDVFTIFADSEFPPHISSLHVYDCWGNEVFEQLDFQPNELRFGWNGSFRGEDMNAGVFVWYAWLEFLDGSRVLYKGDVSLLR